MGYDNYAVNVCFVCSKRFNDIESDAVNSDMFCSKECEENDDI